VEGSIFIKIPRERIGALVGTEGRVKAGIEDKLSVKLQIDSESGVVESTLVPDAQDPTVLFRSRDVVTAIGRGFSPEIVFRMLEDDETVLKVIDLREVVGRSQSDLKRLKGRIIGRQGKTRRIIEELSEANVCVYGHTISIIGKMDQTEIAKTAIMMLIRGRLHSTVYRFLTKKRHELKKQHIDLWEPAHRK
jgi:ribosomal RNA assembly protein